MYDDADDGYYDDDRPAEADEELFARAAQRRRERLLTRALCGPIDGAADAWCDLADESEGEETKR